MPVHVPFAAVSTSPSPVSPEIVGRAVFTGEAGATTPLCADEALALPPAFVAVTRRRIVLPTSALTCV